MGNAECCNLLLRKDDFKKSNLKKTLEVPIKKLSEKKSEPLIPPFVQLTEYVLQEEIDDKVELTLRLDMAPGNW
jgi:hypothetical protein